MKKQTTCFLSAIALCCILVISSCGPDEPIEQKYLYESKSVPLGGMAVCCQQPGNNCVSKHTSFIPYTFRMAVEHDSLSWYFQTQDWQNDLPELEKYPLVVDSIIRTNPKGLFLKDFAFLILRDKANTSATADNVMFALKMAPDNCKEFLDQF